MAIEIDTENHNRFGLQTQRGSAVDFQNFQVPKDITLAKVKELYLDLAGMSSDDHNMIESYEEVCRETDRDSVESYNPKNLRTGFLTAELKGGIKCSLAYVTDETSGVADQDKAGEWLVKGGVIDSDDDFHVNYASSKRFN